MKNINKIIILSVVVLIAALVLYSLLKEEKAVIETESVKLGTIVQSVSETGAVKAGEQVNLGFNTSGIIDGVNVVIGDSVISGQRLARLNTAQLTIQLHEAEAALEAAQAQLNKLLAGSSPEEIAITQTAVNNAQVALTNAKRNLSDVELKAQEKKDNAYGDALNTMDDAKLKTQNAYNFIVELEGDYFNKFDQESFVVSDNKNIINDSLSKIKTATDTAKEEDSYDTTDTSLNETRDNLDRVAEALSEIRDTIENSSYTDDVTSADKTKLDTHRSNINTAITNVTDDKQTISTTKLDNDYDINNAEHDISVAEGDLRTVQNEHDLKKAGPRQVEIDVYKASVSEAQTRVDLLSTRLSETVLSSPVYGKVTDVKKRVGEAVKSTETILTILPLSDHQIDVDIYEEDVVKVNVGDSVNNYLVAFPGENIMGKVASIDPAEKLVDGVVYYEITISLDEQKAGLRNGMTVDVEIITDKKENVLVIPEAAVEERDAKYFVQVKKGEVSEDREVELGLQGDDRMVEVLAGLEEGEDVIIP